MRVIAPLLLVLATIGGSNVDAQLPKREWLDESSWPQFVHDRGLPLPEVQKGDEKLPVLLVERYNATLRELRNRYTYWLQGVGEVKLQDVADAADRLIKARMEVDSPAAGHVKLLEEQLDFAKTVAKQAAEPRNAKGRTTNEIDRLFAESYRLSAAIELQRAKQQPTNRPDGRKQ